MCIEALFAITEIKAIKFLIVRRMDKQYLPILFYNKQYISKKKKEYCRAMKTCNSMIESYLT